MIRIAALSCILLLGSNSAAHAAAIVGKKAPAIELKDSNGKVVRLDAFKGKFVVLEWVNFQCPFVGKQYGSGNMQKLQKTYTEKGVVWLSICSSAQGKQGNVTGAEANTLIAEKEAAPSRFLLDPKGTVGKLYGAKTTPHMFVIDPKGTVLYNGAIDDKPSTDRITCPRCGETLPSGVSRCDACGAFLVPAPTAHAREGPRSGGRKPVSGGASGPPWLFLVIGLLCGGAVGYALHGAVGPRSQGGMPTGPADVMRGAAGADAGDQGEAGGGQKPPQMPPQVTAMVQQYRQALARDPDDLEANIGFGNLLFDSGQWEKAIDHYQRALKKSPGNADVRVDMAIAIHSLGQNEVARKELERVTREQPTHLNAWLNLGVVAATLGDNAAAMRAWERYLALDPNGQHAAAVRAEIERLKKPS